MNLLHASPPSFEEPLEMLQACHEKVRHFARLAPRVAQHVAEHGVDTQAQEAATAIIRYFDLAAPLHHQDEEEDLFPALTDLDLPELTDHIRDLTDEHLQLAHLWQATRAWLQEIQRGHAIAPPLELPQFAQAYPAHADREERDIYPYANRLPAGQLLEIGTKMAQRRRIN